MLVPVDLMSMVSAGSSSANAREESSGTSSAATSWLLAADADASSASGNDMINKIFMSYTNDGEANPAARFAEDLKALLSAHGVLLAPDQSLLPEAVSLVTGQHGGESDALTWSVDELLQMSMSPMSGGNNLPLDDQTLPSVLSSWLAALTAPVADTATSPPPASAISALLPGGSGAPGELATGGVTAATSPLSTAAGGTQTAPGLTVITPGSAPLTGAPGVMTLGGSAEMGADSDLLMPTTTAPVMEAGRGGIDQEVAVRVPVAAEAARQAAETAQLNPGSQKVTSDAANASAFRSIQFSQSASGDSASAGDTAAASQPDLIRAGTSQDRTQGIASQLTASMTGLNAEPPASSSSSQLFNPADGSAIVNRAEQRMFATESAQQAQSQAAQHTATRTAEGLPRFAMDTAFGQQGWSDSLGRQLLVMSSQGISSAQIRLDPPELGSLTVKIQMSADQQASVSFVSQHALVREALEQQLNRLQDLFRDQGLNLQDVSVSDQSPQQRDGDGDGRGQQGQGGESDTGEQDRAPAEPVLVRSESLIDFYA